jgi:hypothetical protein
MELVEEAEALYRLPRDEFTAARGERVKAARAAGNKDLATALGKLRRPTVAAWLINQLARERPDTVTALADLGEALRAAHHNLDGAALRELTGQRQAAVRTLVAAARDVGRDAGQSVSDAVLRELEEMFTAALASPDAARALASGRVTSAKDVADPGSLEWPDTDPDARPSRAEQVPASKPKAAPKAEQGKKGEEKSTAAREARARAEAELERLTEALTQAEAEAEDAEQKLQAATTEAEEAHRRVADLRAELTEAEQEEKRAREVSRFARRTREDAERTLAQARKRRDVAAQRLDGLGG